MTGSSIHAAATTQGFTFLGEIRVTPSGRVVFPKPPPGGGLYFLIFKSGGAYVGETGRYGRDGAKTGRFDHYANPADDIWTELVIHEMLVEGGGGEVHVFATPADKRGRLALESRFIKAFTNAGIQLWNDGAGRDEKGYLSWLLPIAERMQAAAKLRYATREALTPYATNRLAKLAATLAAWNAAAARDGVRRRTRVGGPPATSTPPSPRAAVPSSAPLPWLRAEPIPKPTMVGTSTAAAVKPAKPESVTSAAHRYLAEHPGATLDDLKRDLAGIVTATTAGTLWADFQMTMEALTGGDYVEGERRTLTIRRIVCRLWQAKPGHVDAAMVTSKLAKIGREEKASTVGAVTGNVISTLRALGASRPNKPPSG